MHFNEVDDGDYRIYVGAIEASVGSGYTAAVVISRLRGLPRPREAFRDSSLAGGHRWVTPGEALNYAVNAGRQVLRSQRDRLAC
jgi:hypothetical protein